MSAMGNYPALLIILACPLSTSALRAERGRTESDARR